MKKLVEEIHPGEHSFWCPGCHRSHTLSRLGSFNFSLNVNLDKPSFSYSNHVCKVEVLDGVMKYDESCKHSLAGSTVMLTTKPDFHKRKTDININK